MSQHNHDQERARAARRHAFPAQYRRGLYEAVFQRRDIRKFVGAAVPDAMLARAAA